jgi:tripartite-type tricarboxylate transporter receptor subunit TctC
MPGEIVDKLAKAFEKACEDEGHRRYLAERGGIVEFLPPDKLFKYCEEKRREYRIILDKAGLLKG